MYLIYRKYISQYSNIHQLSAVTAYVIRFVNNLHKPQHMLCGPLSSLELACAQCHLIKGIQHTTYSNELAYLLMKQSKCPPLINLIRCGGRIHNAPTSELAKFPILLPTNCSFTKKPGYISVLLHALSHMRYSLK